MNETSIILSSGSLIALFGMYMKMQNIARDAGAKEALIEKRLSDLEKETEKNNNSIEEIKTTLHQIDLKIVKILSKLESGGK